MKAFGSVAAALAGLVMASSATAIEIEIDGIDTDVGEVDVLTAVLTKDEFAAIAQGEKEGSTCSFNGNGNGEAAELCVAAFLLGEPGLLGNPDYKPLGASGPKVEEFTPDYGSGDAAAVGAFALADMTSFFWLKNAKGHLLYENVASLAYAVFDTADEAIPAKFNFGPGKGISHATPYMGGPGGGGEVPLPGTLALLGAGLVGFGLTSRRRASR